MNATDLQKIHELYDIILRLRAPDGCPWDQKQTPLSFKKYVREEAEELVEAIEHDDVDHVREELGDLLFQVLFVNHLYEEQGKFTFAEVIDGISAKMIRRHPHVFAATTVSSERELRAQWEKIKAGESRKTFAKTDESG